MRCLFSRNFIQVLQFAINLKTKLLIFLYIWCIHTYNYITNIEAYTYVWLKTHLADSSEQKMSEHRMTEVKFLTLSKNLLSFTAFDVPAARYLGLVQSWENITAFQPQTKKYILQSHKYEVKTDYSSFSIVQFAMFYFLLPLDVTNGWDQKEAKLNWMNIFLCRRNQSISFRISNRGSRGGGGAEGVTNMSACSSEKGKSFILTHVINSNMEMNRCTTGK